MQHTFSLAYLTCGPVHPVDAVKLAAKLGYDAVGLRALPAAPGGDYSLFLENKNLVRETAAALRDTGVTLFDMEIIRLNETFSVQAVQPFLELCGTLGAKAVLVAADDRDESRLVANYAAFCQAAAPFGVTADLEFMPWTAVRSATDAVRVVRAAGQPNAGILVDALHAGRSQTTWADIAAIPRDWLHYAQLCDAPGPTPETDAGLIYTARCARFLPGEGDIDVVGMVAALPRDLPLSIEIPHEERRGALGVEEWARQALVASRRIANIASGH